MIRYLKHNQIDMQHWDLCISTSGNRLIYALSWYLDIVSPGWDALVMDDYRAVMPLTWKKKFGIRYLVQPPFCQQLGVFGIGEECENAAQFIDKIPRKFIRIRIQLNKSNHLTLPGATLLEKTNYELHLDRSYPELFDAFATTHKKNIKTGRNRSISISKSADSKLFWDFFQQQHKRKFKLQQHAHRILQRLISAVESRGMYKLFIARNENGEVVAAIFLLVSFDRWYLLLTPTTEYGSKNRSVYLLVDHFIREFAGSGQILDFEGSSIEGIAKFFQGFGSRSSNYLYIKFSWLPFIR
jgi:hypothetical protein